MTIFQVPNFGSVLQTFATQEVLTGLGYECDVIHYRYPNSWHSRNLYPLSKRLRLWLKALLIRMGILHLDTQRAMIGEFRQCRLHLTREFKSLRKLEEAVWDGYAAVIAGSDQIWNPRFLNADKAFMLSFVPGHIRKISVASSFACDDIPAHLIGKYRTYLSGFSSISVRDANGTGVITDILGLSIKPEVILDPTLLLSASDWRTALALTDRPTDGSYIFVYVLDYAFDPFPYVYDVIREMKRCYNCKVIAAGTWRPDAARDCGAEYVHAIGPAEFVDLVRRSVCVITNSFHGTAFALNFGRPLVSIIPPAGGDDRQTSLLDKLGLRHLAATLSTPVAYISPEYDDEATSHRLTEIRTDNIRWISEALSQKI